MSYTNNINKLNSIINNYNNIKLIKYNENINNITLHFSIFIIDNYIELKLITDFNEYCYIDNLNNEYNNIINDFNLSIIFKKKNPEIILDDIIFHINKYENNININNNIYDSFHIYQKFDEFTKYKINYIELEKHYNKYNENNRSNKLLFSSSQINKLIINEIKLINKNINYNHYICINYSEPYKLIIRLIYDNNTNIGKILTKINNNFGYNYIEFNIILDSISYPFIPPKLEYIKPCITNELLIGLLDLNILKNHNWNATITLEYLIINIANQFENIGYEYIILNKNAISFNILNYNLIKLLTIIKYDNIKKIPLEINIPKLDNNNNTNVYWKSGTGYTTNNLLKWDINLYIKEQENQNEEIISILINIYNYIKDNNIIFTDDDIKNILLLYLTNQLAGINLLEIEKYDKLYNHIFNLLEVIINKNLDTIFIADISKKLETFFEELDLLLNKSNSSNINPNIVGIYNITKLYYYKNRQSSVSSNEIELTNHNNILTEYCNIMKKLQFGICELHPTHRFNNYKNNKPEQSSLIRILSEISGFKSELPLNWESSIWVRIPKSNYNILSFLISGPKDTPYENGLFEFHAYFPINYPNSVPEVLLNTTGNDKVRFNPNLYDSGKVCLSLLNTWNGGDSEKWNSKTSTFLQVMISIQSLILVDQPYFNEPGYEKTINTEHGKNQSDLYNEEIYSNTIKLCMIDMINNPPSGFEQVVINHFKFKKEEILNTLLKWEDKSNKFKENINKYRLELELII